jgi:acyl-CoA synthetase (AMP-forming)/AMP-acid ligase II
MTADYIAFHASARPDAVAVVNGGHEITYGQFDRDIRAFTRAARGFGLSSGSLVAVEWLQPYPHFLLLIALERLGIVTASYLGDEGSTLAPLLADADLVLSGPLGDRGLAKRHQAVTEVWLREVFASADVEVLERTPSDPAAPLLILRTSGTTGVPKRVLLTRRMFEAWVDRWIWSLGINRASRYLPTAPFTVTGIYTLAIAAVRSGGTVVFDTSNTVDALAAHAISHVVLNAIGLKRGLDILPEDYRKPANLTLCTIGAATASSLREKALARLASEVVIYYGSNEIPFIAETRTSGSEGVYSVFPWVRAEIVDDNGEPSPPGTLGRIRLQADTMASGYLDDPEATAAMFRDGWFYPGDTGILHGPRLLQIVGRSNEVLNIGGQKIAPSTLEALVLEHAKVGDVGVCSVRNSEGIEQVHVAVSGAQDSDQELAQHITRAFAGRRLGNFFIVKLDRIPRNANGKIERGALKELIVRNPRGPRH